MIDKEELGQIMKFVSEYWEKLKNDSDNEALKILPTKSPDLIQIGRR